MLTLAENGDLEIEIKHVSEARPLAAFLRREARRYEREGDAPMARVWRRVARTLRRTARQWSREIEREQRDVPRVPPVPRGTARRRRSPRVSRPATTAEDPPPPPRSWSQELGAGCVMSGATQLALPGVPPPLNVQALTEEREALRRRVGELLAQHNRLRREGDARGASAAWREANRYEDRARALSEQIRGAS